MISSINGRYSSQLGGPMTQHTRVEWYVPTRVEWCIPTCVTVSPPTSLLPGDYQRLLVTLKPGKRVAEWSLCTLAPWLPAGLRGSRWGGLRAQAPPCRTLSDHEHEGQPSLQVQGGQFLVFGVCVWLGILTGPLQTHPRILGTSRSGCLQDRWSSTCSLLGLRP